MKTLKNTLKITAMLLMLLSFAACKKDKTNNAAKEIKATDLVGYYLAIERADNSVRLVYFINESGSIKAYYDGPDTRRIGNVTMNANKFLFDLNGDGASVLEFAFSSDASGTISLNSLRFSGTSTVEILNAEMFKTDEALNWGGKTFIREVGIADYFKYYRFSESKILFANSTVPTTEPHLGCYILGANVGFKDNNGNLLGIFVPSWKGNKNIKMLLKHKNITGIAQYQNN